MHGRFIGQQQNRQYDVTCQEGIGKIFLLQIVHQTILERMCGFICASEFGKLVAGQGTLALVIERVGRKAVDIL